MQEEMQVIAVIEKNTSTLSDGSLKIMFSPTPIYEPLLFPELLKGGAEQD